MARRLLRWLGRCLAGFLVAVGIYGGLVKAGVIPNLFGPVAGGDLALARSGRAGHRVLFVGNSFTFKNDLPGLVHRLSERTDPVFAASYTAPGWRLSGFARDGGLDRLLRDVHWEVVVLQEQSRMPSGFDFAVRTLVPKIEAAGARPLLFMTWGYRSGYAAMQQRLAEGYSSAARDTGAQIAPVGLAWAEALRRRPRLELWAGDGRHPSREGSYLGACVFYTTLTGKNPMGNTFTAGLRDARFLQRVAWEVARYRY